MKNKRFEILPKNFDVLLSFFYKERFEREIKFGRFKIDFYSKALGIAFEYDGIEHYSVIEKIHSDKRKELLLLENGIRLIRWPYYFMPTSDTCKYVFGDVYSDEKFTCMLNKMFKVDSEQEMLSPGFHNTPNIPANFTWFGIERFLDELSLCPQSVQHQVRRSLKLYCENKKNEDLDKVYPTYHPGFMKFIKNDDDPIFLGLVFTNDPTKI
jgi:hypothetical protein